MLLLQVPLLFREANVLSGFRPLYRPWWYYILSILHLHNESMNVWTHILAVTLMTVKLVRFSFTVSRYNQSFLSQLMHTINSMFFYCGLKKKLSALRQGRNFRAHLCMAFCPSVTKTRKKGTRQKFISHEPFNLWSPSFVWCCTWTISKLFVKPRVIGQRSRSPC